MEMDIDNLNDQNERTTPVQGFSIITVGWDPDFSHHLYRGEIKVDNPHPKQLVGQPGVHDIQRMDYFFIMYSMTKEHVKKMYGVELPKTEGEEYPEINYFHAGQSASPEAEEMVTVIVAWHKKDGVVGKFAWCNDTVLDDKDDFYARRLTRCTKCGAIKYDDEQKKCEKLVLVGEEFYEVCGGTRFEEHIEETETLLEGVIQHNGNVIPAGTEVPYYKPSGYPIVIRKNVPVPFQLGGQSDVDVIRDQADAIKKIVSRLEEKIIRGSAIVKALEGHRFELTNELYQVIRGEQQQLSVLGVEHMTDDVYKELDVAKYMYESARNSLGITNSWQGKEDRTARSGVAKQVQVERSSGRLQSKWVNKRNAFKELYRIMFEFKLAYFDETRNYMRQDEQGNPDWGLFNKYDFLEMDAAGEYFYNTDFLFEATVSDNFPKDRMWLLNQTKELFAAQAMPPEALWMILDNLNFPMAEEVKQMILLDKQKQEEQQQLMQQQPPPGGMGGGMPI